MNTVQKNIDIIHNCEERFFNWLQLKLSCQGITPGDQTDLSELLDHHEGDLDNFRQHLKPLVRWSKVKDVCYEMSYDLNGQAESDEDLLDLLEKTAFEGQVLWLTFQEE
jgi:hypothetical protein